MIVDFKKGIDLKSIVLMKIKSMIHMFSFQNSWLKSFRISNRAFFSEAFRISIAFSVRAQGDQTRLLSTVIICAFFQDRREGGVEGVKGPGPGPRGGP